MPRTNPANKRFDNCFVALLKTLPGAPFSLRPCFDGAPGALRFYILCRIGLSDWVNFCKPSSSRVLTVPSGARVTAAISR